jgi:2-oxoisovalerate dehydrogenase E1 component
MALGLRVFPERYSETEFYPIAYHYMYLARTMDNCFADLFRKGSVKGTVALSHGTEATAVGMSLPFRSGIDVVSLLHRDIGAHLVFGADPAKLVCQYMANAQSPTHGREGNVHHGDQSRRRFPMLSHLGNMLSTVVGGVWAARRQGEDSLGLTVIGDGGTSTGDFHESLNIASVRKIPVLFVVENNHYAFSTPTRLQYACANLSDRAAGYGIPGKTIDGTDVWEVYCAVCDALEQMRQTGMPFLLECRCLRLMGHAVYDQADYVSVQEREEWLLREPLMRARLQLSAVGGLTEESIRVLESAIETQVNDAVNAVANVPRPDPTTPPWHVFAPSVIKRVDPFTSSAAKNGNAVTLALDYLLQHNPEAFLLGQDIGPYCGAFKTSKGLSAKYGPDRVMDMPICESATVGMALGASQTGGRPIMEFQFADFGTEAVTQIGLNAATWFFRSGGPAPLLFRMPCGGGINLGAFHSGEFEGLWSRFPGLKLLYPSTPQETFEALVAGFYDPNPVIVFEHKLLYWSKTGPIDFSGDLTDIFKPRTVSAGDQVTIVAWGAMIDIALAAAQSTGISADIWNPFILQPLALEPIIRSVAKTGRLLVVQESGATAGLGNNIIAQICIHGYTTLKCAPQLVCAPDTPAPFAKELESRYIPDIRCVVKALTDLMGGEG